MTTTSKDGLIDLRSGEGQQLLQEARSGGGTFQPYLGAVFSKQRGSTSCGIQASALILAASSLGRSSPVGSAAEEVATVEDIQSLPFTEEKLLDTPAVKVVLAQTHYASGEGLSLDEVASILKSCGHKAEAVHASDSSVDDFRTRALQVLKDPNGGSGVFVNYHMATLGQGCPYGHHSPVGAYHRDSDRFLIYDCWPTTRECWAKTPVLFSAMNTMDNDAKKVRGFCIVNPHL